MSTLERIKLLCKQRSISVKILEERLDFPNNTIYQWKTRTPGTDKLEKVADYFNVSMDYLLGRTDVKEIPDSVDTIAAHHDGEDWTDEELQEIERFKEFVRMKRNIQE
ncbi:transcriptional regulator [Lysinibacillus sp. PLM2]|nr:transcriptional regulator [Lysinibacillus sp. PLM2]